MTRGCMGNDADAGVWAALGPTAAARPRGPSAAGVERRRIGAAGSTGRRRVCGQETTRGDASAAWRGGAKGGAYRGRRLQGEATRPRDGASEEARMEGRCPSVRASRLVLELRRAATARWRRLPRHAGGRRASEHSRGGATTWRECADPTCLRRWRRARRWRQHGLERGAPGVARPRQ
jgi:hypothetical protein